MTNSSSSATRYADYAGYAGYDDDTLALLANPGLVRRAAKLAPTATWVSEPGAEAVSPSPRPGRESVAVDLVQVADFEVRLDPRGPAHARCPCPTAGICVHVLAAAMYVRDSQPTGTVPGDSPSQDPVRVDSPTPPSGESPGTVPPDSGTVPPDSPSQDPIRAASPTPPSGESPGTVPTVSPCQEAVSLAYAAVLAEVLGLDPAVLCRRAGVAAVRRARTNLANLADPANPAQVSLSGDTHRLDIIWPGATVRYVAGAGWDGMVSSASPDDRPTLHLEAIARLFQSQARDWPWPADANSPEQTTGPTPQTRALIAEVRAEIARTITAGLSHLGQDAADRFAGLALDARVEGLPLLASYVGTAAALLEALGEHRDEVSEPETLAALAKAWALSSALDAADAATWPALRGTARRTYTTDQPTMTLTPLGATWSVTNSGARVLTLIGWETEADELRLATSARPVGTDPSFIRTHTTTALWGAALDGLLEGPFRIDGPRLSGDRLSATARSITYLHTGLTESALSEIAVRLRPTPPSASFSGTTQPIALVSPSGFGKMAIDEPLQQLVWSVPLGDATWQLRQEITPTTLHRVDELLAWEADRLKPAYLLARRATIRGRAVWEPTSLFRRTADTLRQDRDTLTLCSLDFPTRRRTTTSLLQKHWAMLRRRWEKPFTAPPQPRPAVLRTCDDVREVLVDLAATGRLTPSSDQRRRLTEAATRCDDLALATLATQIRRLLTTPTPYTLLSAQLVADRVAQLSADFEV